jgi:hypothetical protein
MVLPQTMIASRFHKARDSSRNQKSGYEDHLSHEICSDGYRAITLIEAEADIGTKLYQ